MEEPKPSISPPPKTKFTDEEILYAVYSDYKVPEGFFIDSLESGENIYDDVYYIRIWENNKWEFLSS